MYKALVCLVTVVVLSATGLMATSMEKAATDKRAQAKKLYEENNCNDALKLYRELALDAENTGKELPEDLGQAITCLNNLGLVHEADDFLEAAVATHKSNFRLLTRVAHVYSGEIESGGFVIAGKFERGGHRGGGQWASVEDRDRVRSLQLLMQAIALAELDEKATASEKADLWQRVGDQISAARHSEAWKLQDLTDLETLPDFEISQGGRFGYYRRGGWGGSSKGAPVDQDGNPVFHHKPESWNASKSDGERWRWAMAQVVQLMPKRRSQVDLEWAGFLQSQFGVGAAAVGGPPVILTGAADGETPKDSGEWAAHELADSETIAKLTTGVKRFTLPDKFNHITILKAVIARNDGEKRESLESLINERMNRHQYPQAAELLREELKLASAGDDKEEVQARIDQIVNNWLQIESTSVQPAGKGATLDIRFRNGSKATFEARPIRIDDLLTDVRKYIETKPPQIDGEKIQIQNIGWMLIHNDGDKYLEKPVAKWKLDLTAPDNHFDAMQTVTTPLQKAGAYWVTAKMADGNESRIVLWVADTAISRKRVEDGTMYYVADAVTGAPVDRADLEFFGWRQEYQQSRQFRIFTSRFADRTDADGLCTPNPKDLIPQNQWIVIARTKDGRLAFDGFTGVWNPEKLHPLDYSPIKVYAITDRPVYRPGHTVKYRMWLRQARFSGEELSFADKDYILEVRNPKGDVVREVKQKSDRWGGVDGEYVIPADATLGSFQLRLCEPIDGDPNLRACFGTASFVVEEYRKPEYEVKIEAPDKPVKLGEKIQAKIIAKYYFGAPVTEAKVHYKVERTKKDSRWYPIARWDWLYSPGYWWFAPEYNWYPGFSRWGCMTPIRPWWNWSPDPPEIVVEGDAEIGEDGTFLVDIDTAAALASHSDSDHNYAITAEVVDKSRRTIIGNGSVLVARDPFKVFTWTDRGHYQTGDTVNVGFQARTPDDKPVKGSGKLTLFSVKYEGDKPVEQEVQSWDVATKDDGSGTLKMTVPDAGQFRISVKITDSEGHEMEGGYVLFVRGPADNGGGYRFNDLELITEKQEYQPGEKVQLQINTNKPDSTVLLFVRPMNGLCSKPIVVRMKGKSTVHEIAIERTDMPNIFVEAVTIADGKVHSEMREIVVPPEQRIANVEVIPSAERYRPGEEATVKLKLTDLEGQPFVGNTVLSVYDASLEYIAASSIPEIRSFFWNVRRQHHASIQSTLQRGEGPVYRDNEVTMQILYGNDPSMDGGGGMMGGMGGGFGGGRGAPRMMMARGMVMESMAAPAAAMEMDKAPMAKDAVAAAPAGGDAEVAPTLRSNFADTAYWVASSTADEAGIVEVKFTIPDNLTTWKIKAWAMGDGTRVGSGTSDIISSKDLIIRPQTPRFFTERDQIVLSAVVHNYLASGKSVKVVIENEGGHLKLLDEATQTVSIAAKGEARINWTVDVVASGLTTIRMKALTDEESDAVEVKVPVQVHGMLKTESFTGVIRPNGEKAVIEVRVPEERIPAQSRLEIRYSPSLAGAMVDTLPYLLQYPYGCTEQTLNRFLPAVLTQRTLQKMGVNLADVKKQRTNLDAQQTYRGVYPKHWGEQPQAQTRDIRELPAGFGQGSSTLAKWIQQHIDEDAKLMRGKSKDFNPVFDDVEMNRIIAEGVKALTEMQLSDGGWGWFSGYGEHSSPHLTAQVVHGLTVAQQNDVPILPDVIQRGIDWLKVYQASELTKLREGDKHRDNPKYDGKAPYKMSADNMDAFVAMVLSENIENDPAMTDYLYRDRGDLSVYGLSLTGLVLHWEGQALAELPGNAFARRDMVIKNIEQFLEQDDENQTAWLRLPENSWWYWYGSDNEAMAVYLKLLVAVRPNDEIASRLVKYLLNNRKHGTYWDSTRDTAMVVESMADYIKATGEDRPDMTVEILINGELQKTVKINGENLFSFDNVLLLQGDAVTSGNHKIEVRRSGKGPVYFSAYLTNFTKEDNITAAGLEVKVARKFYRLERDDKQVSVQGDRGQVVTQQVAKYKRIPLEDLRSITSGDLIEVEMVIDSKNDYEYLLLEDHKPSGFEPDDQRSGYVWEGLRAYRELRDDRVSFFLTSLARGQHSISYRMRAETPGTVSALPATIEGMYAPELVGNSDEFRLRVVDGE
ncbi:MAG TPA: MG2 domain-containing protein [Planctomycetaceae bacterium]|nr:MG2 domain-containing protein [Planctomycetaceae bacterium]